VYRESLLAKLSYLPRLTFAERLRHLIDDLTPSLRERVIGDAAQQERFIKRVKTLRNAHAHRMKLKERTVGFEFVRLASKLRVIIDWSLLTKIGLQKDEIELAIDKCPEYRFYAYRESWPWDNKDAD
jgi:hypothetical protein